MTRIACFGLLLVLAACAPTDDAAGPPTPDTGTADASRGTPDVGPSDAEPDARPPDVSDAASPDATPDAEASDAALPDAEIPDAEIPDAACVPVEEQCNGTDDDCDEAIDEGFEVDTVCETGVGQCRAEGQVVCQPDGTAACDALARTPMAERCTGLDEDCDGSVDEGLGLGEACQNGVGACQREGVQICTPEGEVACDVEPGPAGPELCNDLDDDCDGQIDEGFGLGEPCEAGVGACVRPGLMRCAPEGGAVCDAVAGLPAEERCNQADDDCDGATDEGFGLGAPCEAGTGACVRQGEIACQPDGAAACNAVPGPPGAEACNGIDDDCDGFADEGLGVGTACFSGVGACATDGVRICGPDGQLICNATPGQPGVETCNRQDDDCDGGTDEGFNVGVPCNAGVGVCFDEGTRVCTPEGLARCTAEAGEPSEDLCNGLDDDCDGQADEDFQLALNQPCTSGLGICTREGLTVCRPPDQPIPVNLSGVQRDLPERTLLEGGFERCFVNRYNDNGAPLEEVLRQCSGEVLAIGCRRVGSPELAVAAMGSRIQVLDPTGRDRLPRLNIHNSVYWYFDGDSSWGFAPQEAFINRTPCDIEPGGDRLCWNTVDDALASGARCGDELLDNSADWERVVYQRAGPLNQGLAICGAEPGEAGAEICNGLDDDCDGRADEGNPDGGTPCEADAQGTCRAGAETCIEGQLVCTSLQPPNAETCDGLDNDCNGVVDDVPGLGSACTVGEGACEAEGVRICEPGLGGLSFSGIRNDLTEDEVLAGGFEVCWRGTYGGVDSMENVLRDCDEDLWLMACRPAGEPTYQVAAMGERAFITQDSGTASRPPVNNHNGVGWYWSNNWSLGFAPPGEPIFRNTCDVERPADDTRMCWHTEVNFITNGWRCGGRVNVFDDTERIIYQRRALTCQAEALPPAPEACNQVDDDCDGEVDEDFGAGTLCSAGVGACRSEGAVECNEAGMPVCTAEAGQPVPEQCNGRDDDCDGTADEGELDCPDFDSCEAAYQAGLRVSGVYRLQTPDGPREVWCDMEADGGGWTLVASSAGEPFDDQASDWYPDLTTLAPAQGNAGVWRGLRALDDTWDVRFACRDSQAPADAPMTVDLVFYEVDWYDRITTGSDINSCFYPGEGEGQIADKPPARRDLNRSIFLPRGNEWNTRPLEGEDICSSRDDFTVDFDDQGMDGNESDGTDWGKDDNLRKCGRNGLEDGQWFIFTRPFRRPPVRPFRDQVLLCGGSERPIASFLPVDHDLQLAEGCEPGPQTLTLLVTRGGAGQLDAPALRTWVREGGRVITEQGVSGEVFTAIFEEPAPLGPRFGRCLDNIMPAEQINPLDPFWMLNAFEITANTGCGFDLSQFPGITPLGGWGAGTVSLAYRDLGEGRVWLVETDWQDGDPLFSAASAQLMQSMILGTDGGAAGDLSFEGVRLGMSDREVLSGGFEECYRGTYAESANLVDVLTACGRDVVLLGCRRTGEDRLRVSAMGERATVFRSLGNIPEPQNTHNGVSWYYSTNWSMGFAPEGANVRRAACDESEPDAIDRLCWFTNADVLREGLRCGDEVSQDGDLERVIYHRAGPL